jgi:hypothetical protein
VIVVILIEPLQGDDSVVAVENRIEVVRVVPIWEVRWAGGDIAVSPGEGNRTREPGCASDRVQPI